MSGNIADMEADLEELKQLMGIAKRQWVKNMLARETNALENVLGGIAPDSVHVFRAEQREEKQASTAFPEEGKLSATTSFPSTAALRPISADISRGEQEARYTTVDSYSWDQDSEKVKVYIFVEGASQERSEVHFGAESFDLRLRDVNGKNLRVAIPKLGGRISPGESRMVVRPSRVTVIMKKKGGSHWADIKHKEDKFKPKLDDTKDPMAGIMNLMKDMYEEGDDEMKRTIAKAWTESRKGNPDLPFQ